MAIDQTAMVRTIYDTIFSAYTQPPMPGLPPISQSNTTFLTLEWSGQQLDPTVFQNPWTPENTMGSQLANEFFAALVNPVPILSPTYADSGVTVEEMYKLIMLSSPDVEEGVNPIGTAFFEAQKVLEFAKVGSLLNPGLYYRPSYATPANWYDEAASNNWSKVTIRSSQTRTVQNSPFIKTGGLDRVNKGIWKVPELGNKATSSAALERLKKVMPADPNLRSQLIAQDKPVDAAIVKQLPTYSIDQLAYQSSQDDYENAVAHLNVNRFQYDLADPMQAQQWEAERPNLEARVQSAWNKIREMPMVDLEKVALKNLTTTQPIVERSKDVLINPVIIKSRLDKVMTPILSFASFIKQPFPLRKSPILESSPVLAVREVLSKEVMLRDIKAIRSEMPLGFRDKLLREYYQFRDVGIDQETSDLQISFRFCRVAIRRPWLILSVLKLKGWHFTGQPAGSFSTGQSDLNPGSFPLLPTAFIAIRDLKISGTWGKSDRAIAELATSGTGNTVAFGPFALSGRYGTDQGGMAYTSKFDGQTLTVEGLQIIGWINQVVPFTPPTAGS
jgi:hypothetical protein